MATHRIPVTGAFPYIPRGQQKTSAEVNLQQLVYAIKDGRPVRVKGVETPSAQAFVNLYEPTKRDRRFLNRERTLVPMPRSSVTPSSPLASQWPGDRISRELVRRNFARDRRILLRRATAVESSSAARSAGRTPPTVEDHIASLTVDIASLDGVIAVTLVDDVVSSGSNTMGAAQALRRAGFSGDIAVFAVAYTAYGSQCEEFYGRIVWVEGRPCSFRRSEAEENPDWQSECPGSWTPEPPDHDEWDF